MFLRVIRKREGFHVQVSIALVFGDVVSEACVNGSSKSFGLSVGLRVVSRCRRVFDAQRSLNKCEDFAYKLQSAVSKEISGNPK